MWNEFDILETVGGQSALILAWAERAALVIGVTAIVTGLLICFLGLKLLRVLSAISGLAVGAGIGTAVVLGLRFSGTMIPVMILICAAVLAVLCAGIRRMGAFFVVFMHMASVTASILIPRDPAKLLTTHTAILLGVCGAAALVAAVLAVIRTEPVTVVVTGISGGLSAGTAASFLLGTGANAMVGYGIGAVTAMLGIWTQFMMQSRKIGKKEEVYSRQMREQVSMESEVEKARKILEDEDEEEDDEGGNAGRKRGRGRDSEDEEDDDITIISEEL